MKKFFGIALIGFIFLTGTAYAYDLPKIRTDKPTAEQKTVSISDWTGAELFEQKLKSLLAENKNLPASSKERINRDKNLVFVAFYKGNAYFLDKYSVKIDKNNSDKQSWKQHIFPIGKGISAQNSKYTEQNFCLQDGAFYNSLRKRNDISEIADDEDRNFLQECFKVGYYYAFNKEIDLNFDFMAKGFNDSMKTK